MNVKPKTYTESVRLRVTPEMVEEIAESAKVHRVKPATVLRWAVEDWLARDALRRTNAKDA